ncbi:sensor histidine kinase [Ahniella affigens]|nr:histidine kinase [Ahniella affigens]
MRVVVTLLVASMVASILSLGWETALTGLWWRVLGIGSTLMIVFSILERFPARLPRGVARWALQVIGVGIAVPVCTISTYLLSTKKGAPPFWDDELRLMGFGIMTIFGILVAPWVALAALVRQREATVSRLALDLELKQSELARHAVEARMNLLTAQVKPHFLFNTLANVHALLGMDSPRATKVLESLIAYLRAAVPRLDTNNETIGHEIELTRAYLDLMQLRMPDRLQVVWAIAPGLDHLRCPPLTLLTLVENAVQHGIDPTEYGGTVRIQLQLQGGQCEWLVSDDGQGLQSGSKGLGTGLKALLERLQLSFGSDVALTLNARSPKGAEAKLRFPAVAASP